MRKEEGGSIKGLKKGYQQYKVPGEIKRSGDLEEGGGAGLRKLDFFRFELSELFVSSSATDIVFVTLPKHSS